MKAPIPDISRDMFDLTGYCSIVTGASVGIGLNIAEALAYRGSDLVLVSRNAKRPEEAAGKVRAIGRRAVAVAADVADDDAPERIVEAALRLPVPTSQARPSMSMGACLWWISKDFAGSNWTQGTMPVRND